MSSVGRSDVRRAHDNYPTPGWCVHRLLDEIGEDLLDPTLRWGSARQWAAPRSPLGAPLWAEPFGGDGAILQATAQWVHARRPSRMFPSVNWNTGRSPPRGCDSAAGAVALAAGRRDGRGRPLRRLRVPGPRHPPGGADC
jgi:hypothetical protein